MQIAELNLDISTLNRLCAAGISTTDELLEEMYKSESKVSEPDAFRAERAMQAAGLIRYKRGDEVNPDELGEPLSWDEITALTGRLAAVDVSTNAVRQVRVCWIYSTDNGRAAYRAGRKSYEYTSREQAENGGKFSNAGRFYALPAGIARASAVIVPQGKEKARMSEEIMLTEEQRAQTLHRQIVGYGEVICQSLYGMCTAIKQMRDSKLYKALGYDTFEAYTEEKLGMKRRQAYNYIQIADQLTEDFVQPVAQIGMRKLLMLTALTDEQRTEIAAHTDLESTTVRELKAQIAALKKQSEQAEKSRTDAEKRAQGWYDKYSEQGEQIASLNAQIAEQSDRIDELESRPVEVAVPEPSREVQNMQDAMRRINREHEEWSAKIQDEHIREIQRLHADYRRQMEAMKTDGSAVFSVYLDAAADAVSRLSEWVKVHGDSAAKKQSAEMLRTYWMEITENGGQ